MFGRFQHRSSKLERLDTGDYTAAEYEACINELQTVNRWMGDSWALKRTLFRDVEAAGITKFSLLDVGAGSGELLRVTARWCRKDALELRSTGVELGETSAQSILDESVDFPEITSVRGDALKLPFRDDAFDYVISSLFAHHLTDEQLVEALREMSRVAARRIFVIDLHRHPAAYFLYTTIGKMLVHTRLVREDGALSILRSFKPVELILIASRAGLQQVSVERHFPFRLVLSAAAHTDSRRSADRIPGKFDQAA